MLMVPLHYPVTKMSAQSSQSGCPVIEKLGPENH